MAFDISTAQPVEAPNQGFDISTAQPVQPNQLPPGPQVSQPPQPSAGPTMRDLIAEKLANKVADNPQLANHPALQSLVSNRPTLPVGEVVGEPNPPAPSAPKETPTSIPGEIMGGGEALLTTATGATGGLAGTIYGFLKQAAHEIKTGKYGTTEAADRIEQMANEYANALTYSPRTPEGKRDVQAIGEVAQQLTPIAPLAETQVISGMAKPAIGSVKMQPYLKSQQLIDAEGNPTPLLQKALNKRGLTYDDLTQSAKDVIQESTNPAIAGKTDIIQSAGPSAAEISQQAMKEQIASGGRSDALAPYKLSKGEIVSDQVAKEAMHQGFEPGTVQMIKATNPETRFIMRKMVHRRLEISKNSSKATTMRPSDLVGDEVVKRVSFIRDAADQARNELNNIANTKLSGQQINTKTIGNAINDSLGKLDVTLESVNGKPKPIYEGSLISKDKTSQRIINNAIDLLTEDKPIDALRAHKLKRQLDIMIDFNKKSAHGLTDAGKNVLKSIRAALNNAIRDVNPEYAAVNDKLSTALDTLNELDRSVGSIDIFGEGANKALGTRLRALLSNQQGRVKIENALNDINSTSDNLGGKFKANINDLVQFSNKLDKKFGTTAETSFAGQVSQGTEDALRRGVKRALYEKSIGMAGKAADKMRGVNDFNAYQILDKLLSR